MDFTYLFFENWITFLVTFILLVIVYCYKSRRDGIPPGPVRWPVTGNLGSLVGKDTLNILSNLRSKYGDVYSVYIGSQLNIFINGYDAIHTALIKQGSLFARRPRNEFRRQNAIVFGNDAAWKELRVLTQNALRDICFKKTGYTLERRITEELEHFINKLISLYHADIDISPLVTLSFANVMFNILHSRRIGYADINFQQYLAKMDESFQIYIRNETLRACFPYFRYLPGDLLHEKYDEHYTKELKSHYEKMSRLNYNNYQVGDENCFIDHWIAAGEKNERFQKENLWIILHDLMAAGSETTATTLKWVILAFVKYPYIQKKLQRKVDEVIKENEVPSMADKANLPYVEAVILEALRIGTPLPLSVPHAVSQDITFQGFKIPKEATVITNISSVHFDPEIFTDPDTFKPERFLNDDETRVTGNDRLIPFSQGLRSCIGETLARMELFLYVTTLAKKLQFDAPENAELPSLKGVFGLTSHPQNFKVRMRLRSEI